MHGIECRACVCILSRSHIQWSRKMCFAVVGFHEYIYIYIYACDLNSESMCRSINVLPNGCRRFWHNIPNSRNLVIGFAICHFHYAIDACSKPRLLDRFVAVFIMTLSRIFFCRQVIR